MDQSHAVWEVFYLWSLKFCLLWIWCNYLVFSPTKHILFPLIDLLSCFWLVCPLVAIFIFAIKFEKQSCLMFHWLMLPIATQFKTANIFQAVHMSYLSLYLTFICLLVRCHQGYWLRFDPDVHATPQHRGQTAPLHQVSDRPIHGVITFMPCSPPVILHWQDFMSVPSIDFPLWR